ncbi:hypothetical protein CesoFtcFv8_026161 [Champsocephalus esox]|uniref:Uncharacterized protein n=1 Tax=Champsocephalus esox TaxID=159716 RepID=A0AAN8B1U9_9TELE|nr:hypothetical protein CesoFtcFv8_026161 [Champsocephalus esox]
MGLGGESSKKHGDAQRGLGAYPSDTLRRQQVFHTERQKENTPPMENSLSHRWRNIPPLPITEAQRPFGQTHPTDFRFVPLPFSLKAQDHREALCPPLQRDAFRRTHDFIQLISKAITFNQTKRGRNMTTLAL